MLIQDTEQPYLDLTQADLQDTFNAASVRYRIAIGPRSGQKTLTLRSASLIRTATRPNKNRNAAKPSTETDRPLAPLSRAERLKRVFKIDIELCPKCSGRFLLKACKSVEGDMHSE